MITVRVVGTRTSAAVDLLSHLCRSEPDVVVTNAPGDIEVFLSGEEPSAGEHGTAVVDADRLNCDPPTGAISFGLGASAQVRASGITVKAGRPSFSLETSLQGSRSAQVDLALVGEHQTRIAVAAAAGALAAGVGFDEVVAGLNSAVAPPGHLELHTRSDQVVVIDDTARPEPESMREALRALAVLTHGVGRSVAVLGEMPGLGAERVVAHDAIGRLVVRLDINLTLAIGPGAKAIADGAAHEGSFGQEVAVVDEPTEAAVFLKGSLMPGDVVLIAGSALPDMASLVDTLVEGTR